MNQQININRSLPLLVKLAPDLTDEDLDDALDVILHREIDGVIATNTTVTRPICISRIFENPVVSVAPPYAV